MDLILLHSDTIYKIVLNTLFVSIPEEFYMVMFTLILLGEFNYWLDKEDFNQKKPNQLFYIWDFQRLLIPTLISALLSNILRYTGINNIIQGLVTLLTMFILIVLTNDIFNDANALKWIGKAFMFFMIIVLSVIIIEMSYTPLILIATGKAIDEINNNVFLNFLCVLPSRLIEYAILIFFVLKKRTFLRGNLIKHIIERKVLSILAFIIIVTNTIFSYAIYDILVFKRVLIGFPLITQIFFIIGSLSIPVSSILIFFFGTYYIENIRMQGKKDTADELAKLADDIKIYTKNENYDNVKWKLNGLGNCLEDMSINLFQSRKESDKL